MPWKDQPVAGSALSSSVVLEVSSVLESSHPKESSRRRAARRPSSVQTSPQPALPPRKSRSEAEPLERQRRAPLTPDTERRGHDARRDSSRLGGEPSRRSSQSAKRTTAGSAANSRFPLKPEAEPGTEARNQGNAPKRGRGDRSEGTPLKRQPRTKRDRRPTPPLLHLVRLLILGVGVGAIAGTAISVWNPAIHPSASATQQIHSATLGSDSGGMGLGRSTAATLLAKGQELTGLTPKIVPMTQENKDLVPGAFLVDLDTGDYFSLNGSAGFSAASMIKVPILVALFQDVDAGRVRLDEKLVLQQVDVGEGSGDMQYAPIGSEYTVLQTATNMITISDNTATNMVIRRLGGIDVLNQRFSQWGLQQTGLRNLLPDLAGTNLTSPKELSMLMAMVSQGELLSMKSRDRALDIMQRTVTDTLLPTSLGEGSTISHKTGDIGSLVGDTGIIDMPNGKRYAITLMVKRPHNDDRAQELIRQMAGTVYDYLNQSVGGRSVVPAEGSAPEANPEVNPEEASGDQTDPNPSVDSEPSLEEALPNDGAMMVR
ncbi:MAG: serine hydrolase [Oscillatoriophycideae cyanobacterium NC_groundwater_1537_Pr4_S-0.65um_50_18]|nr:serine hydrolase [Oscillatoriophycideae cyanobacterium NC_groundwater_1537_Pr4_S-0.65um_50_18]